MTLGLGAKQLDVNATELPITIIYIVVTVLTYMSRGS
jgi:hypothetical protein